MSKFTKIAFPNGGIVPAEFARSGKQETLTAFAPVEVTTAYARHLIADRFAVEWTRETAQKGRPPAPDHANAAAAVALLAEAEAKARTLLADAEVKAKALVDEAEAKARTIVEAAESKAGAAPGTAPQS